MACKGTGCPRTTGAPAGERRARKPDRTGLARPTWQSCGCLEEFERAACCSQEPSEQSKPSKEELFRSMREHNQRLGFGVSYGSALAHDATPSEWEDFLAQCALDEPLPCTKDDILEIYW
ncbi:hypothetical protein WJX72_006094 [[Myrmecia] bisecta]|uniref:Uncharacterized protein n=1 Tax=[Myrmecia] bisecta TaxID=41462 RepID=A0AAW1Q905_9CHLO